MASRENIDFAIRARNEARAALREAQRQLNELEGAASRAGGTMGRVGRATVQHEEATRSLNNTLGLATRSLEAFGLGSSNAARGIRLLDVAVDGLAVGLGPAGWLLVGVQAVAAGYQIWATNADKAAEAQKRLNEETAKAARFEREAIQQFIGSDPARAGMLLSQGRRNLAGARAREAAAQAGLTQGFQDLAAIAQGGQGDAAAIRRNMAAFTREIDAARAAAREAEKDIGAAGIALAEFDRQARKSAEEDVKRLVERLREAAFEARIADAEFSRLMRGGAFVPRVSGPGAPVFDPNAPRGNLYQQFLEEQRRQDDQRRRDREAMIAAGATEGFNLRRTPAGTLQPGTRLGAADWLNIAGAGVNAIGAFRGGNLFGGLGSLAGAAALIPGLGTIGGGAALGFGLLSNFFGSRRDRQEDTFRGVLRALNEAREQPVVVQVHFHGSYRMLADNPDFRELIADVHARNDDTGANEVRQFGFGG